MDAPWYVLIIDDEPGVADDTVQLLNGAARSGKIAHEVTAVAEESFDAALEILSRGGFDLVVLDVFDQVGAEATSPSHAPEPKGRTAFEQVRERKFLPIIFHTALPHSVEDLDNTPFVQIVSKSAPDPTGDLIRCIETCLASPFPRLQRQLQCHIDEVTREFMIEFVEENWNDLQDREHDVGHLLMRRLGVSLDSGSGILTERRDGTISEPDTTPPVRYYVLPPPDDYRMGDILIRPSVCEPESSWYVIMTPSCDLVSSHVKADSVLLTECVMLEEFDEYREWVEAAPKIAKKRQRLERLLKSNASGRQRHRYFYLPKTLAVPHMMVDLQRVVHVPFAELVQFSKVASLDSPYAEALSHQFHCYMGRIGTPDLDLGAALPDSHT